MTQDVIIRDEDARLAYAQALYKLAAREVSTKEAGNLRARVDAETLELFEVYGTKSRELRIGEAKVGSLGVTEKFAPVVEDFDALDAFMRQAGWVEDGFRVEPSYLTPERRKKLFDMVEELFPQALVPESHAADWTKLVKRAKDGRAVTAEGEVVPGVGWERRLTTTLRGCEPEDVAAAMGAVGGASAFAMLEGGND